MLIHSPEFAAAWMNLGIVQADLKKVKASVKNNAFMAYNALVIGGRTELSQSPDLSKEIS